jgi:hypothetical protein
MTRLIHSALLSANTPGRWLWSSGLKISDEFADRFRFCGDHRNKCARLIFGRIVDRLTRLKGRGASEDVIAQGQYHRLSKARAFDIQKIFEATNAKRRNQISPAQPSQSLSFLMPGESIYNVALQFERCHRQQGGHDCQDD